MVMAGNSHHGGCHTPVGTKSAILLSCVPSKEVLFPHFSVKCSDIPTAGCFPLVHSGHIYSAPSSQKWKAVFLPTLLFLLFHLSFKVTCTLCAFQFCSALYHNDHFSFYLWFCPCFELAWGTHPIPSCFPSSSLHFFPRSLLCPSEPHTYKHTPPNKKKKNDTSLPQPKKSRTHANMWERWWNRQDCQSQSSNHGWLRLDKQRYNKGAHQRIVVHYMTGF